MLSIAYTLVGPKSSSKMGFYLKSPPSTESALEMGSIPTNSIPIHSRALVKMENTPYLLFPLGHFLHFGIFSSYVRPLDLEPHEIYVFKMKTMFKTCKFAHKLQGICHFLESTCNLVLLQQFRKIIKSKEIWN